MTRTTRTGGLVAALAFVVAGVACSERTEDKAAREAREAGDAARRAGESAATAAREAGRDAASALENAGQAAGAAIQSADVKTSLMADTRVDAGDINVDAVHETRTIVLKGRVPNQAQKTLAEQIAAEKAAGYRIDNQLVVDR